MITSARRGGKPKGYKHTGTQIAIEDPNVAEAERLFLMGLNSALPSEAWDQLLAGSTADILPWSHRWNIRAPCVIEAAKSAQAFVAHRPNAPTDLVRSFVDRRRGFAYPESWKAEYEQLNALPTEVGWLDDVLNSALRPIAPGDAEAEARALAEQRVLAPIGADPLRENREAFLRRAANHWNSRDRIARKLLGNAGTTVSAPTTRERLGDHVRWVIEHRVKGRPFVDISADDGATEDAVKAAIRDISRLLRLSGHLRAGRRPLKAARKKKR